MHIILYFVRLIPEALQFYFFKHVCEMASTATVKVCSLLIFLVF